MPDNINSSVLLVGAGPIAIEYAKVMRALNTPFIVVGRGAGSSKRFFEATTVMPVTGGLETFLDTSNATFQYAIVAVNIESLVPCTRALLSAGIKRILVEKPGALTAGELAGLKDLAKKNGAEVFISYNRRFFASTMKAKEIISIDGGATSLIFEFTEWSHVIEKLPTPDAVKRRWVIANSSHVADLAFFLGGEPETISCNVSGSIAWHPSASAFVGSGTTKTGALFSYHANWDAPGRWGVEVLTRNHRLILRPLEQLQVQKRGSVAIEAVETDDSLDLQYKPGFFRQVNGFLSGDTQNLQTLEHQVQMLGIYTRMAGYCNQ